MWGTAFALTSASCLERPKTSHVKRRLSNRKRVQCSSCVFECAIYRSEFATGGRYVAALYP